ncbi:RNA 2',3'-cyclic phosphodiesterase [Zobellella sp. DQSA1]|uniref:RNA 2',3'-cyclic phosphodiesterase n=1 Tax=Zobellella sp. DQSA1 TaxID=3342386 RepID=UPI0035C091C7
MNEPDNRLFLAFPADALAPALSGLQDRLRLPGRRIPAHQFHLTLRFLGHTETTRQQALTRRLGKHPLPAFNLSLDRLGCFSRAGVVWIGPTRVPEALAQLAEAMAQYCASLGIGPPHKAFRPHITLYRHCSGETLPDIEPIGFRPEQLCLYRATPTGQGPVYDRLQAWPLRE